MSVGTAGVHNWAFIGQGGTQVFAANSVSGLINWYDADDLLTITKDGANAVSGWQDKSGLNRHLDINAGPPVWQSNVANSRGGIYFNGGSYLHYTGKPAAGSFAQTAYLVVKPMAWSTGGYQTMLNETVQAGTSVMAFHKDSGNTNLHAFSYNTAQTNSGAVANNTLQIVACKFNGASGWARINATKVAMSTGSAWDGQNGSRMVIGAHEGGVQWWTGYICEILLYNKAVSDAEDLIIQTYLNNKWGVY